MLGQFGELMVVEKKQISPKQAFDSLSEFLENKDQFLGGDFEAELIFQFECIRAGLGRHIGINLPKPIAPDQQRQYQPGLPETEEMKQSEESTETTETTKEKEELIAPKLEEVKQEITTEEETKETSEMETSSELTPKKRKRKRSSSGSKASGKKKKKKPTKKKKKKKVKKEK
eukprot:CAMPEP_0174260392 /NCGR_PEP_ID=MMETSP0439-20130205/9683_1 /TAXON_ID=0 /ORGANISM="Stereomyxa ramosa, Strain Chinc5" /LENGTH=172 /DNA_ID=CAMNT_0015344625 /DNA_START=90 /DNA_END=608 /DNA_ORIENTATION=+